MGIWLQLHWKKLVFVMLVLGAIGFGFVRKGVEERISAEWTQVNREMQSLLPSPGETGGDSQAGGAANAADGGAPAVSSSAMPSVSASPPATDASPPTADTPPSTGKNSLININTASASRLDELPGIGPGKAKAIVEHRESKGAFKTIEELKNVKGIGQKTFDGLKGRITVSAAQ